MPACEGPPERSCPHAKPKNVKFRQGDMFLCEKCHEVRFPRSGGTAQPSNASTSEQSQIPDAAVNSQIDAQNAPVYLVQPLLAYVTFALQSGTVEKIKNAVIGFFFT